MAYWSTNCFRKSIPPPAIGAVTEPLYAFPAALLAYEFSFFSPFSSLIQDGSSGPVTLAIQTNIAHKRGIRLLYTFASFQALYMSR